MSAEDGFLLSSTDHLFNGLGVEMNALSIYTSYINNGYMSGCVHQYEFVSMTTSYIGFFAY
jgi:hypothetical protein